VCVKERQVSTIYIYIYTRHFQARDNFETDTYEDNECVVVLIKIT